MSMQYVDLIEKFLASELGVSLDVDALSACTDLTADQLNFFAEQLSAVDDAQHAEMVQVDPRRVVVHRNSAAGQGWVADDDIRPVSAMFTHPYNKLTPIAIDHLKRQLLFFSRIAIHAPELRYGRNLAEEKSNFLELLKAYIELKPLIENCSVVLLPRKGFYSNEIGVAPRWSERPAGRT